MELLRLSVWDFGCVERAELEFGPGLNVLFGPNDLGKSTLAHAIRSALLMQPGSSGARPFVSWGTSNVPRVELVFDVDGRAYRLNKAFAKSGGSASLAAAHGSSFTVVEEGRGVEAELRRLLGWGIPAPGGAGGTHKLPRSFLSTALLGEQATPYGLFGGSLADDPEGSGKERLATALQSLATDERYERVLGKVREHVDEAFTATGRRSKAKQSPFMRASEEVRRCQDQYDELVRQVQHSEAVAEGLAELGAKRDRAVAELAQARERLEIVRVDVERARKVAEAEAELADARARAASVQKVHDEVAALEAESGRQRAAVPALQRALAEAERAVVDADEAVRVARQRVESRVGEDPEARQRLERLQAQRLELAQARHEAGARRDRCAAALAAEQRRAELEAAIEAVERSMKRAEAEAAASEARNRASAEALRRVESAVLWVRLREAEVNLQRAEQAAAQRRARLSEADTASEEAEAIRRAIAGWTLPSEAVVQRLRRLDEDLRLARARQSAGLAVRFELEADLEPRVQCDDEPSIPVEPDAMLEAERKLVIDLGRAGTVTIMAGSADDRRRVEALERAWRDEAVEVLESAGVEDVAALQARVQDAEAALRRADALHERAAMLRADAQRDDPSETLRALQEAVEARRQACAAAGDEGRGGQGEMLGEAALAAEAAGLRTTIELESRTATDRRRAADEQRGKWAALEAQRDEAGRDAERAAEGLSRPLPEALAAAEASVADLDRAIDHNARAIADHEAETASLRAHAEAELAATTAAAERARANLERARAGLDEAKAAVARADGELHVKREQARDADRAGATAEVERRAARLDDLPRPSRTWSAAEVSDAEQAVRRAELVVQEANDEVRKQEGALAQVGGDVVRERADNAREALEAARRREAEVELDYDAWSLLLQTLRDAENQQGQHLGDALGREVGRRFAELTGGRYRGLALGPELQAQGVSTADGLKPLDAFSEGIKEQLATIFRLSVAEQLHGALVLDDHLTQTDPARIGWFREVLRDAGASVQIIVLTCRPLDYLSADELGSVVGSVDLAPRLRAIDLTASIARCSSGRATVSMSAPLPPVR